MYLARLRSGQQGSAVPCELQAVDGADGVQGAKDCPREGARPRVPDKRLRGTGLTRLRGLVLSRVTMKQWELLTVHLMHSRQWQTWPLAPAATRLKGPWAKNARSLKPTAMQALGPLSTGFRTRVGAFCMHGRNENGEQVVCQGMTRSLICHIFSRIQAAVASIELTGQRLNRDWTEAEGSTRQRVRSNRCTRRSELDTAPTQFSSVQFHLRASRRLSVSIQNRGDGLLEASSAPVLQ